MDTVKYAKIISRNTIGRIKSTVVLDGKAKFSKKRYKREKQKVKYNLKRGNYDDI